MAACILTSMFPNGLDAATARVFNETLVRRSRFAFVASEFEHIHEKTDKYFRHFLQMLADVEITFEASCVVDGRMTPKEAQDTVANADVVWLAGGDTPTQFYYFEKYGLKDVLRNHQGVVIGMSAGSINMAKSAICTLSCGHREQLIYEGLGLVDVSVEPHFDVNSDLYELLKLSEKRVIHGLCDDAVIVCRDEKTEFYGEIYRLDHGKIERI